MENPRGHLENMWYMAEFSGLIVRCTYCHYGARWMKPTSRSGPLLTCVNLC
jgi:hypothetical protein